MGVPESLFLSHGGAGFATRNANIHTLYINFQLKAKKYIKSTDADLLTGWKMQLCEVARLVMPLTFLMNILNSFSNIDMEERIKVVSSSTVGVLLKPKYPQSMTCFKKQSVFSYGWTFTFLFVTEVHGVVSTCLTCTVPAGFKSKKWCLWRWRDNFRHPVGVPHGLNSTFRNWRQCYREAAPSCQHQTGNS